MFAAALEEEETKPLPDGRGKAKEGVRDVSAEPSSSSPPPAGRSAKLMPGASSGCWFPKYCPFPPAPKRKEEEAAARAEGGR